MNNEGFYKKEATEILYAPNIIQGPGYVLIATDKDSYNYPVDGWIWAQSEADAIAYFETVSQNVPTFDVQPENYKLAAGKNDEAEFIKLVTLMTLSLSQSKILPDAQITIWDHTKLPHNITVERFLEIMVDYGMFCYMQRQS
jgi:hypothetical protein